MKILVIGLLVFLLSACRSTMPETPLTDAALFKLDGQDLLIEIETRKVRVKYLPATVGESLYLETDDALKVGGDGITVQDLQAIAREAPR